MRAIGWVLLFAACGSSLDATTDAKKSSGSGSDDGSGSNDGSGGSGSIAPQSYTSGTRIKAQTTTVVTTTSDGASLTVTGFSGWYDSQLNTACSAQLASDATTRCIPPLAYMPGNYYVDSGCTTLAVLVSGCTSAPSYGGLAAAPSTTCPAPAPSGSTVYAVGAASPNYYIKSGTTCSGPTASSTELSAYAAGAVIPPSSFAEMTVTTTH